MCAGNRALFQTGHFLHTNVSLYLYLYLYRYINLLSSMPFVTYQHFQRDRNNVANFTIVSLFYFAKPFQYLNPGFPVYSIVIRPANRALASRCVHNSCTSVTHSRLAVNLLAMELTFHATEILQ
jgi:hypothetical protein